MQMIEITRRVKRCPKTFVGDPDDIDDGKHKSHADSDIRIDQCRMICAKHIPHYEIKMKACGKEQNTTHDCPYGDAGVDLGLIALQL